MKAKMREAPASAVTMELNWLEIWETGLLKLRESVRNEAMAPSVSVPLPCKPMLVKPEIAIYPPKMAMMTYCT